VDTILLVNTPDGNWHFNDDYRGTNSAITFQNPMQGQYDIWTGSYPVVEQPRAARHHRADY
jgi:hypothetical protein